MAECRYCGGEGHYYVVPLPENLNRKLVDAIGVSPVELESMKRVCFCVRDKKHG